MAAGDAHCVYCVADRDCQELQYAIRSLSAVAASIVGAPFMGLLNEFFNRNFLYTD